MPNLAGRLAEGGVGDVRGEGAKGAAGAAFALLAAAGLTAVEVANQGQDGGEDAAVDAHGGAGQGQQLRTVGINRAAHMFGIEAPERRQAADEQGQLLLAQGAQQIARTQLAGDVELGQQPALHLFLLAFALPDFRLFGMLGDHAAVGLAHRFGDGGVHGLGVEAEAGGERVAQGLADPDIEFTRQVVGQPGMVRAGGAQRYDPPRGLDQGGHFRVADLGGEVAGQGGQHRGLVLLQDGGDDRRAQLGAARHLDLMFDGGLGQQAHQVWILQNGAGRDDRPGDLDVVEGQHIDQGGGRPGGGGQLLGQPPADVALSLHHQAHEDRGEQGLDRRRAHHRLRAFAGVAQVDDGQQQALAVLYRAAPGET